MFFCPLQQLGKEGGKGAFHLDDFPGDGLAQADAAGMESVAGAGGRQLGAVEKIAGQRVADMGHVQADLMGAAGFQPQAKQGIGAPFLQGFIMGHRPGSFGRDHPAQHAGNVQNRGIYCATPGPHSSTHQSLVFPVKLPGVQLLGKKMLGVGMFGYGKQAGGVPVQPVDTPEDKRHSPFFSIS